MRIIHELSPEVQTKIAAGEVIERPAYIVKELIDNAIDAQAKKIVIHVEDGGLGQIIVTDDGIGMSQDDLSICFKRYTTSKLKSVHDLSRIKTMGFRGEALASIAGVSLVTIRSRPKDQVSGGEVIVEDGVVQKNSLKGMPTGTQVIVENIFSKFPGRQKFLKSKESEYRLILDIVNHFVLAFPEVRFEFTSGNSKLFLFPITTFENRVHDVLSTEVFSYLLPFEFEKDYITISGFTSKPQLTYKSTRNLHTFLNKRFIHESSLFSVVKEAYGTLLEPARYPHLILFITIPHQLVDVNVHPRKETVHFVDSEMVHGTIQEGIRQVLERADLHFLDKRWNGNGKSAQSSWYIRGGETKTKTAQILKNDVIQKNQLQFFSKNKKYFQLHNLYIAAESKDGILLFDQHAVHERVLFEELNKAYIESIKRKSTYSLKVRHEFLLSDIEKNIIEEYKELLAKFGFMFEVNGNEGKLIQVPLLLKDHTFGTVVREVLDEIIEKGTSSTFNTIPNKMLTYLSCRGAVKAGDTLTQKQCQELIEKLQAAPNPYTCPHGRPTQVEINLHYLHKLFKRE